MALLQKSASFDFFDTFTKDALHTQDWYSDIFENLKKIEFYTVKIDTATILTVSQYRINMTW